ncbi:MAG: PEPxxWA-CTERM sorting domain-containing protein [Caulobacterales bacterium]|jgi:hypothetical protein
MTKYFAGSIMVAVSLLAVSGASAATLAATTGTPLTYAVHNLPTSDGNLQVLDTNPGGYLVDYTSSSTLHNNGNSGGFAKVSGVSGLGGAGFADLTIDPENPIVGFSAIKFNLIMPSHGSAQGVPTQTDWSFDTRVNFLGGGFQDFLGTASSPPDRYLVSDSTKTITSIVFSNLEGTYDLGRGQTHDFHTQQFNFDGIEQVSFDAVLSAVPEPASWAMMIGGFFGLGAVLRKRRSLPAARTA